MATAALKQLGGVLRDFTKSKEGVKEFEKLGLAYNNNLQDDLYEQWIAETSNTNLEEFTHRKEKEITSIHVKQVSTHEYDDKGKEIFEYYVIWDCRHTRVDKAGNPVSRYLPNQGTYPIPFVHFKLGTAEFGKIKREIDYIAHTDTGYTTKWSKDALLKLIKEIPLTKEGKGPNVGVSTAGGLRFSVQRFDDLLNKSWDDLVGKNVTEDMISKVLRQRSDQLTGVQEKPLTASQVQEMLDDKKGK